MSISNCQALVEAARAMIDVDQAGLLPDLRDELTALRYRWRDPDRDWRYRSRIGDPARRANDLAAMSGLPERDCLAAIRVALEDDWPSVACAAIVRYAAERLQPPVAQERPHVSQRTTTRRRIAI
jgi:hypothetical protein